MQTIPKNWTVRLITTYSYLMPIFMLALLFIFPALVPRRYFRDSQLEDLLARCAVWLYSTFMYGSLSYSLKEGLRKGDLASVSRIRKNPLGLSSLALAAVVMGTLLGILTWWSLRTFAVEVQGPVVAAIAVGNGSIYGMLVFCQYFFLPEDSSSA